MALFRKDRDRSDHPTTGERDFVSPESGVQDAGFRPEPHSYAQGGSRVSGEKSFDAATVTVCATAAPSTPNRGTRTSATRSATVWAG